MVAYKEQTAWENLVRQPGNPFTTAKVGCRVAFMAKEDIAEPTGAEMILWERQEDGIVVGKQVFQGFRGSDADLMLVADAEVLIDVCEEPSSDPIRKLRLGIREGTVLCYFLRTKRELIMMGYEEFVDALGLPLAGCQ